jgi:hypothetical protein
MKKLFASSLSLALFSACLLSNPYGLQAAERTSCDEFLKPITNRDMRGTYAFHGEGGAVTRCGFDPATFIGRVVLFADGTGVVKFYQDVYIAEGVKHTNLHLETPLDYTLGTGPSGEGYGNMTIHTADGDAILALSIVTKKGRVVGFSAIDTTLNVPDFASAQFVRVN